MDLVKARFRNFLLVFLIAIAWTAPASGQDFDHSAKRNHLLPLIIDGGGWQTAILVTNVADASGQCMLELDGRDMSVRRFEQNERLIADGTGATFELAAAGGNLIWSSEGVRSLTYGYAVLECAEPVVARVLFTLSADGELVSMATAPSAEVTDELQFAVLPQIERHMLALTNNNTTDAFCRVSLESVDGANAGDASFSVPVLSTVAQFLDELVELPESFAQGVATVSCNRQVAAVGLPFSGAAVAAMSPVILPKPLISISSGSAVTEGGEARFTITVNSPLLEDLTLSLTVSESSSHVGRGDLGEKQVVLHAGQTSMDYIVATIDDSNDEANGTVRVAIDPARGYQVSETDDSAQVTINDNDEPAVPVTLPPVTLPPVTLPPGAQPPVSKPPVSQPQETQPPVSQPPVSQPPEPGLTGWSIRLSRSIGRKAAIYYTGVPENVIIRGIGLNLYPRSAGRFAGRRGFVQFWCDIDYIGSAEIEVSTKSNGVDFVDTATFYCDEE